jgi:hypothetical protein
MTALKLVFATKEHPDNTIKRIERLENNLRDLLKKVERHNTDDIYSRLGAVEDKVNDNHEIRIADVEGRL